MKTNGQKIRVAINGFGRIGRAFYKVAKENENIFKKPYPARGIYAKSLMTGSAA